MRRGGFIFFFFQISLSALWGVTGTVVFEKSGLKFSKKFGYDLVFLDDLPFTTERGKPALPYKIVNVAIPNKFDVEAVVVKEVKAEGIPGEYTIMPAQAPRAISWNKELEVQPPDTLVYRSSKLFPDCSVEMLSVGDLAGQKVVRLRAYPLRYLPARKKLIFQREIGFELLLKGGKSARKIKLTERTRSLYEDMLKSMVINPGEVKLISGISKSFVLAPGDYEYVVITPPSFELAFYPLVHWKMRKGVRATVVSTSWIFNNYEGADGAEKIRNFIQDANETWGSLWFLLGGDAEYVPVKSRYYVGEWVPGDFYYSDYDDDWISEVFVGRVPAENVAQVNLFVEKELRYEKDPPPEYLPKLLFIGMDLDQWTPSEELKEAIESDYIPTFFEVCEVYDSQGGDHRETVLNQLSQGCHLVNHSDHSGWNELGTGYINHNWRIFESDVDDLQNIGRTSIFYSLGCWSCAFDGDEDCIGEHFVVYNADRAGVAYIGNTRFGWYNYGNIFVYSGKMDMEWWKSLMVLGRNRIGEALADSKNRSYPVDDYYRYIYHELTLLGDPEMPVWTGYEGEITAEYEDTISPGYRDFTVTVYTEGSLLDSAFVCLYKGDEIYERGYTGPDGRKTFQIEPVSDGVLWVTVTRANYRPFAGYSLVLQCIPGDVNGDGAITAADVTFLANYLYSSGPQPSSCGDVNGDCLISSADITYLLNYLYWGGQAPRLPCSNKAWHKRRKE